MTVPAQPVPYDTDIAQAAALTLPVRTLRQSREAAALAEARTCYDHLAGRAGSGCWRLCSPRASWLNTNLQAERTTLTAPALASK